MRVKSARAGTRARQIERAIVWLAALVCLLFVSTLVDVPLTALWAPQGGAPRLPDGVGSRAAALTVKVSEANGAPASGVLVRVFAIIEGRVFLAGNAETDGSGVVTVAQLPAGETWIVAERDGTARTSTRVVLGDGARDVTLTLTPAESFEVVVVDPMQRPIRGLEVALHGSDPLAYRTTTDDRGLARFDGLGPPPYAVEVTAPGYDNNLHPRLGLEDSPLFIKLQKLGGLEVTVVDGEGAVVEGATVLVAGSSLWPARSSVTDAGGKVMIGGLTRGFFDLRADKGDLVSDATLGVMLEQGEHKAVTLALVQGVFVTVKVTDGEADDAPGIANADVALVEGGVSSFPLYARSDAEGIARIGPVAGVDATVSARADGYVARSAVMVTEGQSEVRVSLMRGGKVTGIVVDERGFPIDGVELEVIGVDLFGMPVMESSNVTAFRDDHFAFALPGATPLIPAGELGVMPMVPDIPRGLGPLTVTRSERTDTPWVSSGKGAFEITPVTPGRLRVVAHHPSYVESMSEAFDLAPGGSAEIEIVMKRGGILEGRVVETDRTPAAGARIEVISVFGSLQRVTYAADDGTFAFAALPSSVVMMVSRAHQPENVVWRQSLDIPVDERREIEVVLPEPRDPVSLRVSDERGYPIDQVEIHVSSLESDTPLRKTLFSDEAGEAEVLDARGLSLRIVVTRRGRGPSVVEIERAPKRIDVTMWPGLSAVGSVETRWGVVADAELSLSTPTGVRGARSDETGAFRYDDLAPGPARLLVTAKGHAPRELGVVIEGDGVRDVELGKIDLVQGGGVFGYVRDERGDPIAGARVAAGRVPTYLPMGPLPLGVGATSLEGRFELGDLAPGPTTIEVYKVGYGRAHVDVEVRAGDMSRELTVEMAEDPEVDVTRVDTQASLAVTLGEGVEGKVRAVIFEHVPLGGEAARAGIWAGDRFVSCDGIPIKSLEHARRSLNGPPGEDMVLGLSRAPDLRWRVRVNRERLRR